MSENGTIHISMMKHWVSRILLLRKRALIVYLAALKKGAVISLISLKWLLTVNYKWPKTLKLLLERELLIDPSPSQGGFCTL